ncbi:MAG: sigma-70 family RNA polymerase sigma factor [Clostridiales bacterium]|nr:sigma-70 family RNA polymerase sigma factor [Clostridiales bacterium]
MSFVEWGVTAVDENKLVNKAVKGDNSAFEALMEKHMGIIYNIALRMTANQDDAEDMTQEIMIKIFRSLGSFKGNSKFSTWIYRVAVNTCLDELKKKKNKKHLSLDAEISGDDGENQIEIKDDSPSPEKLAEQNELRDMVAAAVKLLSDEHRAVIVLRDIRGMSYSEIAGILGCSDGTVKSRISRARAQLKMILEKEYNFNGTYFEK